ncbi:hypothetical protein [Nonomuraea sp. NPDC005501]|uniref:hypothetical protein n=1 Tax=Nonomuraea sp. NPDC005501 TaxID=3156884 RepID=UPI0033AB478C
MAVIRASGRSTRKGEDVDVRSVKYGAAVRACGPLLPRGDRLPGAPAAPAAPAAPVRS